MNDKMNRETFIEMVAELRPKMLATARRLLGNDDDAEDAVQDTLLRLWQVRGEPISNMSSFAMTVLRNMCIDRLRRRRTTVDIDSIRNDDDALMAQSDAEAEMVDRMMAMVLTLPGKQQTVLRMRHIEGMKMSEIASLIGTSESAVRQTLSRARRRIYMAMTAVAALLVGIGTVLKAAGEERGICVMYENGRAITDEAAVMASMEQTMADIFQSADVPDIDKQMNDILK